MIKYLYHLSVPNVFFFSLSGSTLTSTRKATVSSRTYGASVSQWWAELYMEIWIFSTSTQRCFQKVVLPRSIHWLTVFTLMRIKPRLKVANRPFSVRWWMLLCALLLRVYFGSTPVTQMATTTVTVLVQSYAIICPLSCQSEQLICHINKMINSIFLSEIMRTNMQTMAGCLGLICVTNHLVRYNATS